MFEQLYSKNYSVGDKWNDDVSIGVIQNRQQAFRSFY